MSFKALLLIAAIAAIVATAIAEAGEDYSDKELAFVESVLQQSVRCDSLDFVLRAPLGLGHVQLIAVCSLRGGSYAQYYFSLSGTRPYPHDIVPVEKD